MTIISRSFLDHSDLDSISCFINWKKKVSEEEWKKIQKEYEESKTKSINGDTPGSRIGRYRKHQAKPGPVGFKLFLWSYREEAGSIPATPIPFFTHLLHLNQYP